LAGFLGITDDLMTRHQHFYFTNLALTQPLIGDDEVQVMTPSFNPRHHLLGGFIGVNLSTDEVMTRFFENFL